VFSKLNESGISTGHVSDCVAADLSLSYAMHRFRIRDNILKFLKIHEFNHFYNSLKFVFTHSSDEKF